ncbi:MAG: LCP family protein [Clostridia bacterium]|nr:LCP family protein [Clostridia bacterium]
MEKETNKTADKKSRKNRTKKTVLIILLILLILLLAAAVIGGIYFMPLYRAYRNSLETIPFIDRPEGLTVPDEPEDSVITVDAGEWTYGDDEDDTDFPLWTEPTDPWQDTDPVDPSSSYATETLSPPDDTQTGPSETGTVTGAVTTNSQTSSGAQATTTQKPVTTTSPTTTQKPVTTTSPTTTQKPVTTTSPTTTQKSVTTTSPTTTQKPVSTAPVTTAEPHEVPSTGIYRVARMDPNVENILLIGLDTRDPSSFSGRSDCMIILSYNKKNGEVKLVSLLRDMLIPISGYGWNRLNSAYAFGGAALCINTINEYFGLDIQKYVTINFNGVVTLIDKCGGVDLALTQEELAYIGGGPVESLGGGMYHLTGTQAKSHMSNRHVGTDFDRTNRQRTVLLALYRKLLSEKSLSEILDIITFGFAYVRTNIPLSYLTSTASSIYSFGSSLKLTSDKIPCAGSWSYGYYQGKAIISINRSSNIAYLKKILWNK